MKIRGCSKRIEKRKGNHEEKKIKLQRKTNELIAGLSASIHHLTFSVLLASKQTTSPCQNIAHKTAVECDEAS